MIDYIKSLNLKNISKDIRAELFKIHEDYYKLIDIIDKKLEVPRIPPEERVKLDNKP